MANGIIFRMNVLIRLPLVWTRRQLLRKNKEIMVKKIKQHQANIVNINV